MTLPYTMCSVFCKFHGMATLDFLIGLAQGILFDDEKYKEIVKRLGLGLGTGPGPGIGDWDWGLGMGNGEWGMGKWEMGKWEIESTPIPSPRR